jgi:PadR family transcriptional regulator PadR
MAGNTENWRTQIRKGYLEMCILLLIRKHGRLYGFDLIERLGELGLDVKEGTLYPLLNRMSADNILAASWDTENIKGHPRKFYALTATGEIFLKDMNSEFEDMVSIFQNLNCNLSEVNP